VIRPFSLALVFLTRIPVPLWFEPGPAEWGRSVFFFPFVGLLIGGLLAGLQALLAASDPGVVAVLLLLLWVLLTGGLHLDGLADTADAWIGGGGDRAKTLAIMKDSRSGPMAIVAVVLVLLAKFAALQTVVAHRAWTALVAAPVLGRTALLCLLLTTPYIRPGGSGTLYAQYLPRTACRWLLPAGGAVCLGVFGWDGAVLLVLLGVGWLGLRHRLVVRLGGITGDTLGTACELTETATLLILILLAS
jgi:adenosylcobinamide-GDP ribazoletransferase